MHYNRKASCSPYNHTHHSEKLKIDNMSLLQDKVQKSWHIWLGVHPGGKIIIPAQALTVLCYLRCTMFQDRAFSLYG